MARSAEYQKRQDGESTVFDVTPAESPKFMYMVIMGGIAVFFGLVTLPIGIVLMAVGAWAGWFGWKRDIRPVGHKTNSSFRVSADTIQSNGQTFKKDDIHRLIIKNGVSNQTVGAPNVLVPVSASMAQGMAQRGKVATVANGLELETGGKGYLLAGGMDETTAFGLLHDVSKVLGFKTN